MYIYAPNTVNPMFTGKAVSTYVPCHMLVDATLNTILIADSYNVPIPTVHNSVNQDDKLMNENSIVEQRHRDILNTDIV